MNNHDTEQTFLGYVDDHGQQHDVPLEIVRKIQRAAVMTVLDDMPTILNQNWLDRVRLQFGIPVSRPAPTSE